jgi:hypothetical protein
MLADLISGDDLLGNNHTRRKFQNTVAEFKLDTGKTVTGFHHQHHNVVELHGSRWLVCVKDASGDALLFEALADGTKEFVVADGNYKEYTGMLNEARARLRCHIAARDKRKRDAAARKKKKAKSA